MNRNGERFKTEEEGAIMPCAATCVPGWSRILVTKARLALLLSQASGNGPKWVQCKGWVGTRLHRSLLLNQGLDIVFNLEATGQRG